jgi:PAS domain S-box-containing protein
VSVFHRRDATLGAGASGRRRRKPEEVDPSRMVRALSAVATHLAVLVEADGTVADISPSSLPLLGYEREELVGENIADYLHSEDLGLALSIIESETHSRGRDPISAAADLAGDYRLLHADGRWVPFEFVQQNMLADRDVRALLVVGRPVAARYALERALGMLALDGGGRSAMIHLVEHLDLRLPGSAASVYVGPPHEEWIGGRAALAISRGPGPWTKAMKQAESVTSDLDNGSALDPDVLEVARSSGFQSCWALPVPVPRPRTSLNHLTPSEDEPWAPLGCLVVWTRQGTGLSVAVASALEWVGGLVELAIRRLPAQG